MLTSETVSLTVGGEAAAPGTITPAERGECNGREWRRTRAGAGGAAAAATRSVDDEPVRDRAGEPRGSHGGGGCAPRRAVGFLALVGGGAALGD